MKTIVISSHNTGIGTELMILMPPLPFPQSPDCIKHQGFQRLNYQLYLEVEKKKCTCLEVSKLIIYYIAHNVLLQKTGVNIEKNETFLIPLKNIKYALTHSTELLKAEIYRG